MSSRHSWRLRIKWIARGARGPETPQRLAYATTKLDTKVSPYAYVSPFFLLFFAFGLFPLVHHAWVSLHSVSLQKRGRDDVGRLRQIPG